MNLRPFTRTLGRHASRSAWCTTTAVSYHNAKPPKRCFSSKLPDGSVEEEGELAQWIRPDRPLVGDKGSSHLYERSRGENAQGHAETVTVPELDEEELLRQLELELQKQEEREKQKSKVASAQEPVDWLQTRRSKQWDGLDLMTPDLGSAKKWQASDVAVIPHTLLTQDEITSCLTAMGGKNITLLPNTPDRRMGAALGMILSTASTPSQVFLLADTLVRQLKQRDLAEVGVIGAQFGAEGSADKTDTWRVVDCYNYIVHILDANTRRHLNLEALWSGKDASLRVRLDDDAAMDDYVAANPVPEGYSPNARDWSSSISQMERNRWIVPHRPVVARPKGRKRRRGRR